MFYRLLIVFFCIQIISATSCSRGCNGEAAENLTKWEESRPNHYSYEYTASCFCSIESVGPYYIEVTGTEIDTAYYLGFEEEIEPEILEIVSDYENVKDIISDKTIDAYFERFASEDYSSSSKCEISYDDQYHFIKKYKVIPPDDIADAGFTYTVANFENLD